MPLSDDRGQKGPPPPLAALFVATFDTRKGYTLSWKRSQPGVNLDGQVEYKSLPSGLHHVQQDLIHFTHDDHAGLSAFQSAPAGQDERNARFIAVGALVPLSHGRLGRVWMHAEALRALAAAVIEHGIDEERLTQAWEDKCLRGAEELLTGPHEHRQRSRSADSKTGHRGRGRAISDATHDGLLSADHPALSMRSFIDTFGPLAFVVHRAALLRQRILILGTAPVKRSCDYVYDLSVFSDMTASLNESLGLQSSLLLRAKPLFNVGVHDISELEKNAPDSNQSRSGLGYLACTTDDILATKTKLYDMAIQLQPKAVAGQTPSRWPIITTANGQMVRATQRDLRRYLFLRRVLNRAHTSRSKRSGRPDESRRSSKVAGRESVSDGDTEPLIPAVSAAESDQWSQQYISDQSSIVEPISWASMTYSSMLWWSSSGLKDLAFEQEAIGDASLLEDLNETVSSRQPTDAVRQSRSNSPVSLTSRGRSASHASAASRQRSTSSCGRRAEVEMRALRSESTLLTAFFHRVTAMYFEQLAEAIRHANDDSKRTQQTLGQENDLMLDADDVRSMGLDSWSANDRQFVVELVEKFFLRPAGDQRTVEVAGGLGPVVVCGIRIC